MSGLLLAIDIGTTGTKACVFTPEGNTVASEYQEYGCTYPRPGWVEQDAEALVQAAYATAGGVMKKIGVDAAGVKAVSFSTQRTCSIFLDREGNLVRPMISWMDNRPVDEVKEIEEKLGGERFHLITGLPLNTTWNLGKLMWLRRNEPENWKKMARFCQLQDFILLRFGSDGHYTDAGAVGLTGMWDIRAFDWCDEILNAFSIDKSILPVAVVPGTRVGTISPVIAEKTGIPTGVAIVVGAGDQHSAIVGAGVIEAGRLSVSLGTGGLVGAYMEDTRPARPACLPGSPNRSRGWKERLRHRRGNRFIAFWTRWRQRRRRDRGECCSCPISPVPALRAGILTRAGVFSG